jgi:hypothetical protein
MALWHRELRKSESCGLVSCGLVGRGLVVVQIDVSFMLVGNALEFG